MLSKRVPLTESPTEFDCDHALEGSWEKGAVLGYIYFSVRINLCLSSRVVERVVG